MKKKEFVENFPCFYFNLRTLYRTKTHSLSITRLNVEQMKCYCSKAIIQQTSHKNIFSKKKQHNHIKLPRNISALNSRFFENIVIPSKLDANRIIKFWIKKNLIWVFFKSKKNDPKFDFFKLPLTFRIWLLVYLVRLRGLVSSSKRF